MFGADVAEDGLAATVATCERGDVRTHTTDISDVGACVGLFDMLMEQVGRLDILVNCAAVNDAEDLDVVQCPVDVFDRAIAVNVRGTFLTCKFAVPRMLESGGGSIVNFTSTARAGSGYPTSKGAISSLTRAVSYQYAARGVRCNEVSPGATATPMLETTKAKFGPAVAVPSPWAVPRLAGPDDIANVVLFLVSDEAAHISGTTITVDGGSSRF